MKRSQLLTFLFCTLFSIGAFCQGDFSSEDELKERADELFDNKQFDVAEPLFSQLLSLYPKDPDYNFKYGACLLASGEDKEKPLKYLNFAVSKPNTDPLAYYYLGRAHHLNYNFGKAINAYKRFKNKVNSSTAESYQVERKIEMCKNGNNLLSRINEVQVLEKRVIGVDNFFRIYELEGIDGKIVKQPEEFMSKYDKKTDASSIIYLPKDAREVYFSSYGKKGDQGRDIFKIVKLGNGKWSDAVNLGNSINTPYDENYPFIHPDGRTLYFASEGHNSMGGYDLFMSTYDETVAEWTEPINLDFAFSSVDNDVLFITDEDKSIAYFASDRTNKTGEITVYKVMVSKAPAELTVINGELIVENGAQPTQAKVTVVDTESKQTVGVFEADKNGKYKIEIPKNGGRYKFILETSEEAPLHTGIIEIPKQDEFEVLGQELRLVGSGAEQQLVIKNIFDGSAAEQYASNGPKISSDLLKQKAELNVNLDNDQIAAIEAQSKKGNEKETADLKEQDDIAEIEKQDQKDKTSSQNKQTDGDTKEDVFDKGDGEDQEAQSVLSDLSAALTERIRKEENEVAAAYRMTAQKQNEAEEAFAGLARAESSGDVQLIEKRKKEAELKAFDAALALNLAQELEANSKKTEALLDEVQETKASMAQLSDSERKQKVSSLENQLLELAEPKEIVEEKQTKIREAIALQKEELSSVEEGVEKITEEQKEILDKLNNKRKELNQVSSDAELENVENQLQNLQLDSADIAFQKGKLNSDQQQITESIEAYNRQSNQLSDWETKRNEVDEGEERYSISESEKLALEESIKEYKDEGKVAYLQEQRDETYSDISENRTSLNSKNSEEAEGPQTERKETASSEESEEQSVDELNEIFEQALATSKARSDSEAREVLDQWDEELEQQLVQKESRLTESNSESEKEQLQIEIDQILQQKEENEKLKEDLSTELAAESTQNGEGESVVEGKKEAAAEETAQLNESDIDVSSIDADTEIDDDFTNLNFEKGFKYADKNARRDLTDLKQTFFEASELAQKAEQAQEAAYTLPTVEERNRAFEDANAYKKASEVKLLEAAKKYEAVNSKEYFKNAETLFNANRYSEDFESSNLDMANLLSEEAEVYFAQAAAVRENINPNERFSKQEVALQKAYDYELMALNKQREALELLELVDEEFVESEDLVGEIDENQTFIQTITDEEVLSISNAEIAEDKADSIQAVVEQLNLRADSIEQEAQSLPVGSERDKLVAEVETIRGEADQAEKQASVYYQRKAQIDRGIIKGKTGEYIGKDIQSPIKSTVNVGIDTVQIEEDRADQIMSSQAYVQYLKEAKENKQLKKSAQVEYKKALDIQNKQLLLKAEAQKLNREANQASEESKKERLIKEATVIEQRAEQMKTSIDSINKVIRVRNYLIQESDRKLNRQLAEMDENERVAVVSLASKNIDKPIDESLLADTPLEKEEVDSAGEIEESETAEEVEETPTAEISTSREDDTADQSLTDEPIDLPREIETEETVDSLSNETEEILNDVASEELPIAETSRETTEEEGTDETEQSVKEDESAAEKVETLSTINQIPRRLESSIFKNIDRQTSIYNRSNPIPVVTKEDLPEGLVYKVQVGAFRNPIPQDMFKGFAPLTVQEGPNGIKRYTAGLFNQERNALIARDEIRGLGYNDAFVVAFYQGERISIRRAREIEDERGSEVASEGVDLPEEADGERSSQTLESTDSEGRTKVEAIEGVFYTVQIGVFSKPLEAGTFSAYEPLNVVSLPNGMRRYNSGVYRIVQEAEAAKNRINEVIEDAFVTAYYQGKRITLSEAARLKNR